MTENVAVPDTKLSPQDEAELTESAANANPMRSQQDEAEIILRKMHEVKGAIEADVSTIGQTKALYEKTKQEIQTELEELRSQQAELKKQIKNATDKQKSFEDSVNEMEKIKDSLAASQNIAGNSVKEIEESKTRYEILKAGAETKALELSGAQTNLNQLTDSFTKKHAELNSLYERYFVDKQDDAGAIITPSLKSQIENLHGTLHKNINEISVSHETIKKDFEALKKDLKAEINSLLPDAGAASLASTYHDAKSRYGVTAYNLPDNTPAGLRGYPIKLFYFLRARVGSFMNYVLFIGPLIFIYALFKELDLKDVDFYHLVAFRVAIAVPLAFISIFGLMSINLNRRLYEEYNHKQRVMQLFHSFEEKINTSGTSEQKQKLLDVMLNVVGDKPSLTMKGYESNLHSLLSEGIGKVADTFKKN